MGSGDIRFVENRQRRVLVGLAYNRIGARPELFRRRHDSIPPRRKHGHSISLEKRSVKATKPVERHQLSHRSLGREERRRSWSPEEMAYVCERESQNSECAKGAVGESEGCEEECLARGPVDGSIGDQSPSNPGEKLDRATCL